MVDASYNIRTGLPLVTLILLFMLLMSEVWDMEGGKESVVLFWQAQQAPRSSTFNVEPSAWW